MAEPLPAAGPVPWTRMTRRQYDALVATGLLEGEPVELIEGDLVEVAPQGERHSDVVTELTAWLAPRLPEGWRLRVQVPLAASDASEPEPDLAVVRRTPGALPTTAALVVEVAVTSHRTDLLVKAGLYAAARVDQYWVLDVPAREVVVHTGPGPHGWAVVRRQPWDVPLAAPVGDGVPVDLAALLDR